MTKNTAVLIFDAQLIAQSNDALAALINVEDADHLTFGTHPGIMGN